MSGASARRTTTNHQAPVRRRAQQPEIDKKMRARQMSFLRSVRTWDKQKLWRVHKDVCNSILPHDHRWNHNPPRHIPRFFIERRLFHLYVLKNWHLERSLRKNYVTAIDAVMRQTWGRNRRVRSDQLLEQHLCSLRTKSAADLLKMPPEEVERLLLGLGYVVDADARTRARVLHEVAQKREGDIIGESFGRSLASRSSPKMTATDVVLAYPHLTTAEILERLPTLGVVFSKKTLKDARYKLKRLGYGIIPGGSRHNPEPMPQVFDDLDDSGGHSGTETLAPEDLPDRQEGSDDG